MKRAAAEMLVGFVLGALFMGALLWSAPAHAQHQHGRKWHVTYNSALSLHEAAVPAHYAHPGQRILLVHHHHRLVVHAIAGGCTCFDISDEGMNRLASTAKGSIVVRAYKR